MCVGECERSGQVECECETVSVGEVVRWRVRGMLVRMIRGRGGIEMVAMVIESVIVKVWR